MAGGLAEKGRLLDCQCMKGNLRKTPARKRFRILLRFRVPFLRASCAAPTPPLLLLERHGTQSGA
jgi:hypothetical protein